MSQGKSAKVNQANQGCEELLHKKAFPIAKVYTGYFFRDTT